jgi:hypothetical protein
MKTFKEFLSEAVIKKWKINNLTVKKAIKILNTNCKQGLMAIKNDGLIYRGFTGTGDLDKSDINFIDTSKSARTSRDTNNFYQLAMDASRNLSEYPSRTKSLICSTDFDTTSSYGTSFVIIPFDGVKVAYGTQSDFLNSYIGIPGDKSLDIHSVTSNLARLFNMLNSSMPKKVTEIKFLDSIMAKFSPELLTIALTSVVNTSMIKPKSKSFNANLLGSVGWLNSIVKFNYKSEEKDILAIAEYLKNNSTGTKDGDFYLNLFRTAPTNKRFTELATAWFKPKEIKISLVDFGNKLPMEVECWVSGKAIVISETLFAEILVELEKLKYPIHRNVLDTFDNQMDEIKSQDEDEDEDEDDFGLYTSKLR